MLDARAISAYSTAAPRHTSAVDFLLNIIPTSIAGAFTSGNMPQIILLGILFGLAISQFRTAAEPLLKLFDLLFRATFGVVSLIMRLAPVGAFGTMAYSVGQYGLGSLAQLAQFTAEVWIVAALFVMTVLGSIARLADFSSYRLLRYIRDELLIIFGTSSSEAVLSPLMAKLEELGRGKSVVGMVLPAGYTFNADGTAIYLSMGAIFIAQATNSHPTLRDQIVVLIVLMLTSKGSAGLSDDALGPEAEVLLASDPIGIVRPLILVANKLCRSVRSAANCEVVCYA